MKEQTSIRIKHTLYFASGVLLAVALFWSDSARTAIQDLGDARYIGALIAGTFYSTSLFAPSATVAFYELGAAGNILALAVLGGLGSLGYDYIIHRFVQDKFTNFLSRLFHKDLEDLFTQRAFFARLIAFIGIIFLASPLPDEIGASLLGLARMRRRTFLLLSFFLNTLGIAVILLLGTSHG